MRASTARVLRGYYGDAALNCDLTRVYEITRLGMSKPHGWSPTAARNKPMSIVTCVLRQLHCEARSISVAALVISAAFADRDTRWLIGLWSRLTASGVARRTGRWTRGRRHRETCR
jgi:hypothetical protein